MKKDIKVFIASTGTQIYREKAKELAESLAKHFTIYFWEDVFEPGDTNIEALEKAVKNCDYSVAFLSSEDLTVKSGIENLQQRDNLIFEFGLFTGALGRKRKFGVTFGRGSEISLPSDLNGLVLIKENINSHNLISDISNKILDCIQELGFKDKDNKEVYFLYDSYKVFELTPKCIDIFEKLFNNFLSIRTYIERIINIYLLNSIPEIIMDKMFVGFLYYIGDGIKITQNNTNNSLVYFCKDSAIA
ncbi:MAG: TIR domain-containing protein [Halarcobacter sp.]